VGHPTTQLRLGYFTRSLVSYVARDRGLYDGGGLTVEEVACSSSPAQFRALGAGEFDLVITSPDNVAAYRFSDANPLRTRLDARILLGLDAGLGLAVIARPEITSTASLRGRSVAVDVASSGFAMALFAVLEDTAGLRAGADYTVVELGSTPNRRQALLDGRCDATLLYAGHDILAVGAGCHRLVGVTQVLRPYLGAVLASTGPWLHAHVDAAQRFVDAWRAATRIVLDPVERAYTLGAVREVYQLPVGADAEAYATVTSGLDGLIPDGAVQPAALRTVLATRARFGSSAAGGTLDDEALIASGLVDERLLRTQVTE
jgi:ABC-type nitrate/sulfonate/bicarbonate transport system substrate-binding protein